jgi:hypothetical protein
VSELTDYSRTDFLKSHFFSSYNSAKSLPIASRPHGFITFVDSDLYPVEADELGKIFIPALTSPLPATAHSTLHPLHVGWRNFFSAVLEKFILPINAPGVYDT